MPDVFDFQGVNSWVATLEAKLDDSQDSFEMHSQFFTEGEPNTAIVMVGYEYIKVTSINPSTSSPSLWTVTRGYGSSTGVKHSIGELMHATLLDTDLYNVARLVGSDGVTSSQFGAGVIVSDISDLGYNADLLSDGTSLYSDSNWLLPGGGSSRELDFWDGGVPAVYESSSDLGLDSHYSGVDVFVVTRYKTGAIFTLADDPDNEWCDLTISAPQGSQFGQINTNTEFYDFNLFTGPYPTHTPDENKYIHQSGYITGSFDYGWGAFKAPPQKKWWVFPFGTNNAVETDPSLNGAAPHWGGGKDDEFDFFADTLRSGPSQELPEVVTVLGDVLAATKTPFTGVWTNQFSSVTTFRTLYTPEIFLRGIGRDPSVTTGARVGIALFEEVSRRLIGFGQVAGTTTLKLWTHTTLHTDSVNSFAELDSCDCGLDDHNIFLRIYVDKTGPIKFLYSGDNVNFFTAFSWSDANPFFTYVPCRVGPYLMHNPSVPDYSFINDPTHDPEDVFYQGGQVKMAHFDSFIDSDDVGIDPETYHYEYEFPELTG